MTEDTIAPHKHRIKSFILRQGRYTSAQKNALDNHWKDYGIEHTDSFINFEQIFGRDAAVTLEIGFGNGDSLLQQASEHPENDYIGIEVHGPGVGHLIHRINEKQLPNIRLIRFDAIDVLNKQIPDSSLDCLQLLFPDPWHKKKHNKRRIVQPAFLQLVRAKLNLGGRLHMATDWQHYAQQMLALGDEADGFCNLSGNGEYASDKKPRTETKFERRGLKLGHGIWDIKHEKIS